MKAKLRILPLGGLGEVGKNMTLVEYGRNIIAIDAGMMFPGSEHLGVDVVIESTGFFNSRDAAAAHLDAGAVAGSTPSNGKRPGTVLTAGAMRRRRSPRGAGPRRR